MMFSRTKRVMSIAPECHSLWLLDSSFHGRIKSKRSTLDCYLDEETKSQVSSSGLIMPRVGARVELVRALKRTHFVDMLNSDYARILYGSNLAFILLFASRGRNNSEVGGGRSVLSRLRSRSYTITRKQTARTKSRVGRSLISSFTSDSDLEAMFPKKRRFLRFSARFLQSMLQIESDLLDEQVFFVQAMLMERYVQKRMPVVKSLDWLHRVLPNASDRVFEFHTRMTRRSFGCLLELLRARTPNLFLNRKGRKQLPIEIQMHLGLFCLGFYGNAAGFEAASAKFGYSVGTIYNARNRFVSALVSLTSEFIKWPDAADRKELCRRVKQRHGYHSAFFLVDGTTHNFAFVPRYDRTSWFDRKSNYSMQALVTCDTNLRVIHLMVGWPGSTHDARVLRSSDYMNKDNATQYFTGEEHGLGDAAFGIHMRVVPNYKEPLASIPENREYNLRHSSLRVKSEHVIGLVKNRFQGLRELRMKLNGKKDVRAIVNFITAGYVLHNILLKFKDEWDAPNEYEEGDAIDVDQGETADDELEEFESLDAAQQFREKVKNQVLSFIGYQ